MPVSASKTAVRHPAYSTQRKGSTARRRSRPLTGRQRLAQIHLQPERVQAIQQALAREGYLQGDPSGQWDARTHDAMLHYQAANGFPATGLPEAKSLMKLGLGSHPLPPELDRGRAAAPAAPASILAMPPASAPISQAMPPS